MIIGNKQFCKNKTYVMGILNVTPDSFSDGGKFNNISSALFHVEEMIKDGASVIDIGGESTRPGYTQISSEEEIERVVPYIEAVKANFDTIISIDTYKSDVAKESALAGADLINDIWGLKYDTKMAEVVKKYDKSVCIMHNRAEAKYNSFLDDVVSDLTESIEIAKNADIENDKIIIDPGIGFAKSLDENLMIMKNIEIFHSLGFPVLIGASRKSMIGLTLNLPSDKRLEGTIATSVIACMKGAAFVRVHDVKENKRAIDMTEAMLNI